MRSYIVVRRTALVAAFVSIFGSVAPAAELDQMFNSLGPAYTSMEGAKVCKLEPQIGPELLAFATERVAKLEQTSKLSQAEKAELRNTAVKEAPTLVVIGACQSVLAAFQILDVQRKFLEAQQASTMRETNQPQSASPLSKSQSDSPSEASSTPEPVVSDETQLPIAAGAYVRSKKFCDDLRKGELDLIDFDLEENRRAFSTGENSCIVSALKQISASRTKVDADCTEFGEVSQLTFMLDRLPNGHIRINGDERLYCPAAKPPPTSKASVQDLIKQWTRLTIGCRGGSGDDPETFEQCGKREDVSEELEALGYCYEGESTATSDWRRCK